MFFPISDQERRRAKSPHELAMVNLLLFNLLAGVALLAGSMAEPDSPLATYKWAFVALPLLLSLLIMLFTQWRASRALRREPWFVAAHWRLAASRYRLLLIAYLVSAAVVSIAFLGGAEPGALEQRLADLPPALQEMERHKLASQHMGEAIWARIGVVPLVVLVLVLVMLESSALYQSGRGEVPQSILDRLPPPDGLQGQEQPLVDPAVGVGG